MVVAFVLVACSPREARVARIPEADVGPDTNVPLPPCEDLRADALTVAMYDFEEVVSGRFSDLVGTNDILASSARLVEGPPGCGQALAIDDATPIYIPHSATLDLETATVEFYLRHDGTPVRRDIFSRDAARAMPGHLTMIMNEEHRLAVRLQGSMRSLRAFFCLDEPLEPDRWYRVAVHVGAGQPQVDIDGVPRPRGEESGLEMNYFCDTEDRLDIGVEGNAEPWYIGSGRTGADSGALSPGENPFVGGAIDALRISVRRD